MEYLTREQILTLMQKAGDYHPSLAYDASSGKGHYHVCGEDGGEVKQETVCQLEDEGLIICGDIIWGGSVQLYRLTILGELWEG